MKTAWRANLAGLFVILIIWGGWAICVQPGSVRATSPDRFAAVEMTPSGIYCDCNCDLKDSVSRRIQCCMECPSGTSPEELWECFEFANLGELCDDPSHENHVGSDASADPGGDNR